MKFDVHVHKKCECVLCPGHLTSEPREFGSWTPLICGYATLDSLVAEIGPLITETVEVWE